MGRAWLAPVRRIELPNLGPKLQAIVRGACGTSATRTCGVASGAARPACGTAGQPVAGFDCSGLDLVGLRENDGGAWKVTPPRPYAGWALAAAHLGRHGAVGRSKCDRAARPGDLMFYDGNDDGTVDHVDTYIGNGWALDSVEQHGGVTIMWVGRRLVPGALRPRPARRSS